MEKAFRKYGWANASNSTSAAAANGTENGEVAASPEDNAALFLSPVTIGGQQFNLDFDTGSSDLWVFSTLLPRQAIGAHAAFNPKKSPTFTPMQDASFLVQYGDGSGAAGLVGTDTVDIGGATVTEQAVELATAVSQSFVQSVNTDGLVGLAFGKLNTVSTNQTPTPQKTFFENLLPHLDEPVFTADLTDDASGTYEFGRIDRSRFDPPGAELVWLPVDSSAGFWQIESGSFAVDGKVMVAPDAGPAILDTGTTLLLTTPSTAATYYAAVPGATLDSTAGGYVYPCATSPLPSFSIALGPGTTNTDSTNTTATTFMAEIPGDAMTFAPVDEANTTCFGGVQGNGGAGVQVFGDVLLRRVVVVFDGVGERVGVVGKGV
ncbi:acid protease [Pseudovirgaria hyperparasitica]|uniref:Acid protease n=1 Tax=Pseudovirgaria hyperparasitica TaxID=470096 RepID=A0A6A6VUM2_9PEZI|nr:acid protease [Pseudovirgaria hyperparasitica]KAF2754378.1 acid protease [Pseudovirgaria hyperparasitica]